MINVQVMRVQRYDQCGELDSAADVKPGQKYGFQKSSLV